MSKEFKRLKGYRAEKGLTQKEMAKILGMNENTYRKKENGERGFTLKDVVIAQQKLSIDPEYYFFYNFSHQKETNKELIS